MHILLTHMKQVLQANSQLYTTKNNGMQSLAQKLDDILASYKVVDLILHFSFGLLCFARSGPAHLRLLSHYNWIWRRCRASHCHESEVWQTNKTYVTF